MFNYCSMLRTWRYRKAHPTLFWRCQSQTNKQMSNLRAFIDFSWLSCTLMLSACNSICQSLSHFMFNHCNMKQNPVRVAHSSYSEGAQGKQTNKCPTFELLLTLADCRALWRWFCLQFRLSKFAELHVQSLQYAKDMELHFPSGKLTHPTLKVSKPNKQMSNLLAFIDFSWVSYALTLILFAIPPVKVCWITCSIIAVC